MSGGQRQRVSIARAAYSGADIYIFDDPLSALDAEVGKAVFDQCISAFLGGKTRLLVTNQLQYLPQCDSVVVLGQHADGRGYIRFQGAFDQLMAQVPDFRAMMAAYGHAARSHSSEEVEEDVAAATPAAAASPTEPAVVSASPDAVQRSKSSVKRKTEASKTEAPATPAARSKSAGSLMTTEEKSEGAVKAAMYLRYFRAAGYVALIITVLLLAYTLGQVAQLVSQWWLSFWSSDPAYSRYPMGMYMGVYVAVGLGGA